MNHITAFWREVRRLEAELDAAGASAYITSVESPVNFPGHKSGLVFEVSNYTAAEHCAQGSHRLANSEEISAHKADQELRQLQIRREQMSRNDDGSVTRTVFVGLPPKP